MDGDTYRDEVTRFSREFAEAVGEKMSQAFAGKKEYGFFDPAPKVDTSGHEDYKIFESALGNGYWNHNKMGEIRTPMVLVEGFFHDYVFPDGHRLENDLRNHHPYQVTAYGKEYHYHPLMRTYAKGVTQGIVKLLWGCKSDPSH